MRKPFILLAIFVSAVAIVHAADFHPSLMRDTFVGKWDVTITPDDDAHKAGERDLTDTVTFKGGQFTSALFAKKGFASVSYDEDTRLGDIGTFTANQKSDDQGALKWAGTVSVDQMTGDLTWTKKDGTAPALHPQGHQAVNSAASRLKLLDEQIISCRRCPRLVEYREAVAATKRRAYLDQTYWGRPVPGFGPITAAIWIVGLAPAAHGANRTGRVFTGDRSGDFLFAGLHRVGLANQPTSISIDDGLKLSNVYVSAAVRCAPPDNKPLPVEADRCSEYLDREWDLLTNKRVILALGAFAWNNVLAMAVRHGIAIPPPRPAFGHAATHPLSPKVTLVGSYHVSQQNTFTGRLTPASFDVVLQSCIGYASGLEPLI